MVVQRHSGGPVRIHRIIMTYGVRFVATAKLELPAILGPAE